MGKIGILIGVLILAGCQANKRQALEDSVNQYVLALQRGDKEALASFVEPQMQQPFQKAMDRFDRFHFSNVEIKSIYPDEKLTNALVLIDLEYFIQDQASLNTSKRQFKWAYNDAHKIWLMNESSPFGRR